MSTLRVIFSVTVSGDTRLRERGPAFPEFLRHRRPRVHTRSFCPGRGEKIISCPNHVPLTAVAGWASSTVNMQGEPTRSGCGDHETLRIAVDDCACNTGMSSRQATSARAKRTVDVRRKIIVLQMACSAYCSTSRQSELSDGRESARICSVGIAKFNLLRTTVWLEETA